jgi:Aldo/keto reductase family
MLARYNLFLPENQCNLEVVTALDSFAKEGGLTLVELALAYVLEHPAVSSAIIGPTTMEQLESKHSAPTILFDEGVLDRIDEPVPPGTNLNAIDAGFSPRSIKKKKLRVVTPASRDSRPSWTFWLNTSIVRQSNGEVN